MKAKIFVNYKPGVLDPEAKAILQATHSLGFSLVQSINKGKYFEVELQAPTLDVANDQIKELCEKLLANTVIETFNFEIL